MIRMVNYDISENKVRVRLVKLLEYQGFERVQYSVFVGQVKSSRWRKCWKAVEGFYHKYCDPLSDRIYCHVIDRDNFEKMFILGHGPEKYFFLQEVQVFFV